MKKINSIHYGGTVITVGLIFALVIPFFLFLLPQQCAIIKPISIISMILGSLILLLFFLWLMIELHQDKKCNEDYDQQKNQKLLIGNGQYECQACGSRQVKESDTRCSICGVRFQQQAK